MDDVTVMVTGVGSPGSISTIHSLKHNPENRKVKIVGVDIDHLAVGQKFSDNFYTIPKAEDDNFIQVIFDICEKEKIDVILPLVTNELFKFSQYKNIFKKKGYQVAVSDYKSILQSNDKYNLSIIAKKINIPIPKIKIAKKLNDLKKYIYEMGYPDVPVCVKPCISRGMRGFRIITEKKRLTLKKFFNEKPSDVEITLSDLLNIFKKAWFKDLMVMEYLPGAEYTVDVFGEKNNPKIIIPRERLVIRSGISFVTKTIKYSEIIKYSKHLAKELGLEYCYGFQFKLDEKGNPKLLECNPRIQGTTVLAVESGANIIYDAVKLALGEKTLSLQNNVKWGLTLVRYWGWKSFYE